MLLNSLLGVSGRPSEHVLDGQERFGRLVVVTGGGELTGVFPRTSRA